MGTCRVELRADAEDCMDKLALRDSIALSNPADWPLRMACIASYPSIVRHAASTDRNPRLAVIRFLMNRWSCSMMLFRYGAVRHAKMPANSDPRVCHFGIPTVRKVGQTIRLLALPRSCAGID